jgi:DNA-binding transcriptional regulator GbsR (MarR family)
MRSKVKNQKLRALSMSVGNFIKYWGFRRIHGAIWTQLYLSKTPLSCTDLTRRLAVSKALISPALDELCNYQLIKAAPAPNQKTKLYVASENINEVIQHVLKTRESLMLKEISDHFAAYKPLGTDDEGINPVKLNSLEEMIKGANLMLELILIQPDVLNMPMKLGR